MRVSRRGQIFRGVRIIRDADLEKSRCGKVTKKLYRKNKDNNNAGSKCTI